MCTWMVSMTVLVVVSRTLTAAMVRASVPHADVDPPAVPAEGEELRRAGRDRDVPGHLVDRRVHDGDHPGVGVGDVELVAVRRCDHEVGRRPDRDRPDRATGSGPRPPAETSWAPGCRPRTRAADCADDECVPEPEAPRVRLRGGAQVDVEEHAGPDHHQQHQARDERRPPRPSPCASVAVEAAAGDPTSGPRGGGTDPGASGDAGPWTGSPVRGQGIALDRFADGGRRHRRPPPSGRLTDAAAAVRGRLGGRPDRCGRTRSAGGATDATGR